MNGVATLSVPALSPGTHSVVAVYSGDVNFKGVTSTAISQVVGRATPQIVLTSSLTTSGYAQPVTFSAVVSGPAGTPSGGVTFYDGTTALGTSPLIGGTGRITVATLSVAAHSITAVYSGDAIFGPATSSPLTLVVNAAQTTVVVSSSPNPSRPDQNFVLTATISTPYGTPTGSVTFKDTSQTLGVSPVINGKATLTSYYVIPGTHYITAQYSGDGNYVGSTSSPYPQQVNVTQ